MDPPVVYEDEDDDNALRAERLADDLLSGVQASAASENHTRLRLKLLLQRVRIRELVDLTEDQAQQIRILEEQQRAKDKRIEQLQRQTVLAESKRWKSDRALAKLRQDFENELDENSSPQKPPPAQRRKDSGQPPHKSRQKFVVFDVR